MQKCKMQNARNADPTTNDTVTRPSGKLKRLVGSFRSSSSARRERRRHKAGTVAVDHIAAGWACSGASRLREQNDAESPATVRGASSVGHETQVALCRVVWHRRARAASACCKCVRRVAEASGEHAQAGAVHLLLCPRAESRDHRGAHGLWWSACVGERRRGALDGVQT